MSARINVAGLSVAGELFDFVETEVLPQSGIAAVTFWPALSRLIETQTPANLALLRRRDELQAQIDGWYEARKAPYDQAAYTAYLREIGYLEPEPQAFGVTTSGVAPELATMAGPQLVVPLTNARYALNALNARWGSLYDALYGTDAVAETPGLERGGAYNPQRGALVVARARKFLDETFPLRDGSHSLAMAYAVADGWLAVTLNDGRTTSLADGGALAGFAGDPGSPRQVLLRHHGLHVELRIDRDHPIGIVDPAGLADVVLEAAITTIMDGEDSVAAVNAREKVVVYRNWMALQRNTLEAAFDRGGATVRRSAAADRAYTGLDGKLLTLTGRSVMLVRNVGLHMMTDMITHANGESVPENIIDLVITTLAAMDHGKLGAMYVVRPKMHGPGEVAFANGLFDAVEAMLGLAPSTLKMGIMDEERRTSANLAACIHAARTRVVFINTGFLDRTGDEIHTAMRAGPVVRKADIKLQPWIKAYEDRNVDIGLACGLRGRAQIGKGMWAAPDRMAAMLAEKGAHPMSGANTAWVPSPTAATLHALHYHAVDVAARQTELASRPIASLDDLLTPPLATSPDWSAEAISEELDNNCQGILGYVVRWIDQGVGCSKVPDIHDVGLMEDRATLRISSQHIANWLLHGVVDEAQVLESLHRMAAVVDRQNADDPHYQSMTDTFDAPAFKAACDMVFEGLTQPNGYTEFLLTDWRRKRLAAH
jgi:malate synthase